MIRTEALNLANIPFKGDVKLPSNAYDKDGTRICKNTPKNGIRRFVQKTTSAFTEYPVKGLKGDPNSDFYEFLTMGTVPYVIGSLTFMGLFNGICKSQIGSKLALGVLFYGLGKNSESTKEFYRKLPLLQAKAGNSVFLPEQKA